jgi:hypothetical protein
MPSVAEDLGGGGGGKERGGMVKQMVDLQEQILRKLE